MMPEFLAREHVAQVHFDERHRDGEKCVAQGDAGMGERARIDDDEGDAVVLGRLHLGDQLVLGIALCRDQFVALRRAPGPRASPRYRAASPRRKSPARACRAEFKLGPLSSKNSRHRGRQSDGRLKRSAIITRN